MHGRRQNQGIGDTGQFGAPAPPAAPGPNLEGEGGDPGSNCEGDDGGNPEGAFEEEGAEVNAEIEHADDAEEDLEIQENAFVARKYVIPEAEANSLRGDSPGYAHRRQYPSFEAYRRRNPGPRSIPAGVRTPWNYLQLFLIEDVLNALITNSNAYGARKRANWKNITLGMNLVVFLHLFYLLVCIVGCPTDVSIGIIMKKIF